MKRNLVATLIAVLVYAAVALAVLTRTRASGQPATQPKASPGPLIVTTGGYYSGGPYTTCSIRTQAPVTLNAIHFVAFDADCVTSNTRPNLTVTNCTFEGTPPHYSVVLWRFNTLKIEHCRFNSGGGTVCMDSAAKSVHFCFNDGYNISGRIDAQHAAKTSFFQCDQIHCADILMRFNRCVNKRGESGMEDGLSLLRAGGTSASPARIENNMMDGEYAWPPGSHPSGSLIMGYDPGSSKNSSEGGFTIISGNHVLNAENVGIDVAGSHGVQLLNNVATAHLPLSTAPMRTWRWIGPGGGTPPQWFGPFVATGNQASWFSGNHQCNYVWAMPQTTAAGNTMLSMSDDENRALWAAKVKAAGVVIGPVPQATSAVPALSYVAASPEVQNVPLPKEGIGPPQGIGYTVANSWVKYSALDFGSGVSTFTVSQATTLAGQTFTVHLDAKDGPLVATVMAPKVSGWYSWNDVTVPATATGTHDVYLSFAGSINVRSFVCK